MHDFDFHPDEPSVRCFSIPEPGILVNDERSCTYQVRTDRIVLRHFAFADEWFKLNATLDLAGTLVDTGPDVDSGARFAVNCDIATPMRRIGPDISAVDLFLDVLVGTDGRHQVVDRDEFEDACRSGLLSPAEARGAERGLDRLLGWITSGRLFDLLAEIPPRSAATAPQEQISRAAPLAEVPSVQPRVRSTW